MTTAPRSLTAEADELDEKRLCRRAVPELDLEDGTARLATQAGPAAMGFDGRGVLAPGHSADLILIDTTASHWVPRHDLAAGVVYVTHPQAVACVWADGCLLYRRGE